MDSQFIVPTIMTYMVSTGESFVGDDDGGGGGVDGRGMLIYSRVIYCVLCLLTHSNGRVYCDSLGG